MRGDSIRDFYAKTLALVGLGMLAGVGAVVDSWPTAPQFALVPSPAGRADILAPLPPVALAQVPARLGRPAARSAVVVLPAVQAAEVDLTPEPVTPALEPPMSEPDRAEIALEAPLAVVAAAALGGPEVALVEPELVAYNDVPAMQAAPVARVEENGGLDGAIVGAFKRTGTSIAKGGVKTGASVVEAFRAVTSVVRKALPN